MLLKQAVQIGYNMSQSARTFSSFCAYISYNIKHAQLFTKKRKYIEIHNLSF